MSPSSPKPWTSLWEQVPREPVKKSGQSPCYGAQLTASCSLRDYGNQPSACPIPLPKAPATGAPEGSPGGDEGGGGAVAGGGSGRKPEAAEAGEAPPAPSSPLLGVFAVSLAGAGAARSRER